MGAESTSAARESVVFDRAAGYYDATRGFPPGVDARVAALFARVGGLTAASRVCELGVGTGRIAVPLSERVGSLVGADLSHAMLARLVAKRGERPLHPVRTDVTRLPFADGRFHAVVAVHVFHLIPGWRRTLAEVARVLRPDGLLLHGADDHVRGPGWVSWRQRVDQMFEIENVGVARADLETFPEREGWRAAGEARLRFPRVWRPRELLAAVEKRQWSMCWRMTDAQVAEAVAALRTEFEGRFGDLDGEVTIEGGFWVRAYRPPA